MHLTCSGLHFTYTGSKTAVIENLSFSMTEPGFNAVFGPSGVGKTSFAKIISNTQETLKKTFKENSKEKIKETIKGNIKVNIKVNSNKSIKKNTKGDVEGSVKGNIETENINSILYTYNLERLPGWSNIGHHLEKVTCQEKQELKNHLVDIFGLKDLLDLRFSQLSMGQQNRINLIRYLLQDFDLLMMDESLANVDEKLRETIILAIKELFPDRMFIYISHHLMEVSKFCRQILVFSKASVQKGHSMLIGQDYKQNYKLDKQKLDATMLEIMNAF